MVGRKHSAVCETGRFARDRYARQTMLAIAPDVMERLMRAVKIEATKLSDAGAVPICLCAPNVRLALRKLMEAPLPHLVVLSYNEITPDVEVVSNGIVRWSDGD